MAEDLEIETYLSISPHKFGIYLLNKKNFNNLYKEELLLSNPNEEVDLKALNIFLEENIFSIEKLIGKFVENISLIVEINKIFNLNFGIHKKNYDHIINYKFLENILIDAKDLYKENYKEQKILHIIINRYLVDGNQFLSFNENLKGENLCIEIKIKSISNNFLSEIDKILEKFQIKITNYLDGRYIKNQFKDENIELSFMAHKILNGYNVNEVLVVPKNQQKTGFFEKFFQLFS